MVGGVVAFAWRSARSTVTASQPAAIRPLAQKSRMFWSLIGPTPAFFLAIL
jgi:hypothetical protein